MLDQFLCLSHVLNGNIRESICVRVPITIVCELIQHVAPYMQYYAMYNVQ